MADRLKIGVIAGEVSGDLLGGDLIAALKAQSGRDVELVGIGGDALAAEGLNSLFDYSELSIMGFTKVIANLPRLLRRIRQTADALIAARPDLLLIIDSPDFTHRVARKVRAALPDLPVVNYVCPSVWAWKSYRAKQMTAYVDHILAVLPFEPEAVARLEGPPTSFVGHRLTSVAGVKTARSHTAVKAEGEARTILLLPGSRSGEIASLLPVFRDVVTQFSTRNPQTRFILPTVRHRYAQIESGIADWPVKPEVVVGDEGKWRAFAEGDAAVAASGTVVLELALARVPVVSAYKADFIGRFMLKKITVWSASLPNIIADAPLVPEYFNDTMRAGALMRWLELLSTDTLQRQAMMTGFDDVWRLMQTDIAPGEKAARVVLDLLERRASFRTHKDALTY